MLRGDQQLGDADYFDVSFSGLKTAVLHAVRGSDNLERDARGIARAFQDALIETLVEKTARAAQAFGRTARRARRRRRLQSRAGGRDAGSSRADRRSGLRADAASRDRQRGDDRARRALPLRARCTRFTLV